MLVPGHAQPQITWGQVQQQGKQHTRVPGPSTYIFFLAFFLNCVSLSPWCGHDGCLSQYRIQISEGCTSQSVLHLLVQDGDLPFTSAWRVKFRILNGNEEGHFDIFTDPETNEGILNVIKVKPSGKAHLPGGAAVLGPLSARVPIARWELASGNARCVPGTWGVACCVSQWRPVRRAGCVQIASCRRLLALLTLWLLPPK